MVEFNIVPWYWAGLAMCILTTIYTIRMYFKANYAKIKMKDGLLVDPTMLQKIQLAGALIRKGAFVFIKTQYSILTASAMVFALLLMFFGPMLTIVFLIGCACSSFAGIFGMHTGSRTNYRTAQASLNGLTSAMKTAFPGGATMGLLTISIGFAGICIIGLTTKNPNDLFNAFSLGATFTALFARPGGGIFTKAADVAADLVGKVCLGIKEDDPSNPAVLADWVGDMVNDIAGMGADLIDSFIALIFTAIIVFRESKPEFVFIPILFVIIGMFTSIIGNEIIASYRFRNEKNDNPSKAINTGVYSAYVIFAIITFLSLLFMPFDFGFKVRIWLSTMSGVVISAVIGLSTLYYTDGAYNPVKESVEAAKTSVALAISNIMILGKKSVVIPMIGMGIAVLTSFFICLPIGPEWGILGVCMGGIGIISNIGIILAIDAFGPIADNAQGIGAYAGFSDDDGKVVAKLDSLGNTTAAMGKGNVIALTAFSTINIFMALIVILIKKYGLLGLFGIDMSMIKVVNGSIIITPELIGIIGIVLVKIVTAALIGSAIVYLFASDVMKPIVKIALKICDNIKIQMTEIRDGIKKNPDYQVPIKIANLAAIKGAAIPVFTVIIVTVAIRFIPFFGAIGMIGYYFGMIITGIPMALDMANYGGIADNAKKLVESGEVSGCQKGDEVHKATVICDTTGDGPKDCGGTSINGILTIGGLLALLFAIASFI